MSHLHDSFCRPAVLYTRKGDCACGLIEGDLRLSASDLMRFKGCRHATTLDLRLLEVGDLRPGEDGDEAELLQRQGDEHELAFLERLKSEGRTVVEIPKEGIPLEGSVRLTMEAMAAGPDVVFQGALLDGRWGGYTDFLERVERPSAFGPWSYEVVDTKLKRRPDPKHVLQLCLYSDLLALVQGVTPEAAHLELGDGSRYTVRLSEVSAYARHARPSVGGVPRGAALDPARAGGGLRALPMARALRRGLGAGGTVSRWWPASAGASAASSRPRA